MHMNLIRKVVIASGALLMGCATGVADGFGGAGGTGATTGNTSSTKASSTVATTVPNFVRGSVVPVTLAFRYFQGSLGTIPAVWMVGSTVMAFAFVALFFLQETFGKDLDYFD